MDGALSVYVACASNWIQRNKKQYDRLVRHLEVQLHELEPSVSSRRTAPPGSVAATYVEERLLRAQLIVVVACADLFAEEDSRKVDLPILTARWRAGEVHVVIVHAAPCDIGGSLKDMPIVQPERFPIRHHESFWFICAEAIREHCRRSLFGEPRYEDSECRIIGEARSCADWRRRLLGGIEDESIWRVRAAAYGSRQLRCGDFLSDRFRVIRRIPRSGSSQRWEGYDRLREQRVVIHLIDEQVPSALDVFRDRLRSLHSLEHRSIVKTLTELEEDRDLGLRYYVTEQISGRSLRDSVLCRGFDDVKALEELGSIADAVAAGHERGIVHGSLGEEYILVSSSDEPGARKSELQCLYGIDSPVAHGERHRDIVQNDLMMLARAVLFCVHQSELPVLSTKSAVQTLVSAQRCSPTMKAFLLEHAVTGGSGWAVSSTQFASQLHEAIREERSNAPMRPRVEMVIVRGGTFSLGARLDDESAREQERPRQKVTVGTFELAKYPVSQKLYWSVMRSNPSVSQDDLSPVHNVSFRDAVKFCNELSMRENLQPVYDVTTYGTLLRANANGYRLPTEAEWEWAAKGSEERLFPWGDEPCEQKVCWNGTGNALGRGNRRGPSVVWSHPEGKTPEGVFDMVGNVWEWCWDFYAPLASWDSTGSELINPIGPPAPARREIPVPRISTE